MTVIALSEGDVLLLVFAIAVPIAAVAFAAAGPSLRRLGKGRFAVEYESDLSGLGLHDSAAEEESPADREAEIRQLVEAKAYRQGRRGERPVDVESEVGRLLDERPAPDLAADEQLVAEVRQLVVAGNERRARRGEEPLDVDAEVERRLRDLKDL
jgi:hypothetical protein